MRYACLIKIVLKERIVEKCCDFKTAKFFDALFYYNCAYRIVHTKKRTQTIGVRI